jgi:hypothetical protein
MQVTPPGGWDGSESNLETPLRLCWATDPPASSGVNSVQTSTGRALLDLSLLHADHFSLDQRGPGILRETDRSDCGI